MKQPRIPEIPIPIRILLIWATANFLLVGVVSWLAGGWYLGWDVSAAVRMLAELGLLMLPNLILPAVVLRCWWPVPVENLKNTLGWVWNGWRSLLVGTGAFLLAVIWMAGVNSLVGESIPYNLPGSEGAIQTHSLIEALGVLLLLAGFLLLTAVGEETMFRGFIQAQFSEGYGDWVGLLLGMLLFGLRHLPADIFYAGVWEATPRMWISRQLQLYGAALLFGLARYFGKSTFAPAVMHVLLLVAALLGL